VGTQRLGDPTRSGFGVAATAIVMIKRPILGRTALGSAISNQVFPTTRSVDPVLRTSGLVALHRHPGPLRDARQRRMGVANLSGFAPPESSGCRLRKGVGRGCHQFRGRSGGRRHLSANTTLVGEPLGRQLGPYFRRPRRFVAWAPSGTRADRDVYLQRAPRAVFGVRFGFSGGEQQVRPLLATGDRAKGCRRGRARYRRGHPPTAGIPTPRRTRGKPIDEESGVGGDGPLGRWGTSDSSGRRGMIEAAGGTVRGPPRSARKNDRCSRRRRRGPPSSWAVVAPGSQGIGTRDCVTEARQRAPPARAGAVSAVRVAAGPETPDTLPAAKKERA